VILSRSAFPIADRLSLKLDLGAGPDPIASGKRMITDGACDVEAADYVRKHPPLPTEGRRMPPMDDPYEDPMQGRTIGHDPAADLTRGCEAGEDTSDDPTQGARIEAAPDEDATRGREIGEAPYNDPTQRREVCSEPSEDPTEAR
jgi:hypothetical protein